MCFEFHITLLFPDSKSHKFLSVVVMKTFHWEERHRNTSLDFSSRVSVVLFSCCFERLSALSVSPRHTNKHVTLTLTQTLSFSSCSVTLEKFSLTRRIVGESPLDAGLRGGEDFSCCDITQIGGDRHADVNWDCVSYVSSAAVCSCVDHSAACSCTHSHKHTTLLSLRGMMY